MGVVRVLLCVLLVYVTAGQCQRSPRVVTSARQCNGRYFPGLGCFTLTGQFVNTNWLPQAPRVVNTRFWLYTRANPTVPQEIDPRQRSSVRGTNFDSDRPLRVLIHGFLQHSQTPFLRNMTSAFLRKGPMNVLVVGWGDGAGLPYSQAVSNCRVVGAETARLLRAMVRWAGLSLENVHLIGHSLGAHVAGYAGARLPGIDRITALDPAQPNFSGYGTDVRLDTSDALFVDVIHTDGVPYNTVQGYGMIEPVGHIDFYPNGGRHQPGCFEDSSILDFVQDAYSRGLSTAETDLSCSHERSTELFTASISQGPRSCVFKSFQCESEAQFLRGECLHCGNLPCPEMGFYAGSSHGARGTFYLNTTSSGNFCGYHHFITVHLPPNTEVDGTLVARVRGQAGQTEWVNLKLDQESSVPRHLGLSLTNEDLGRVVGVDIQFRQESSYFMWYRQAQVPLARVEVSCPMRFPTKYFCPSQMTVTTSTPLTLNSGSYSERTCPLQQTTTQ